MPDLVLKSQDLFFKLCMEKFLFRTIILLLVCHKQFRFPWLTRGRGYGITKKSRTHVSMEFYLLYGILNHESIVKLENGEKLKIFSNKNVSLLVSIKIYYKTCQIYVIHVFLIKCMENKKPDETFSSDRTAEISSWCRKFCPLKNFIL